MKMSKRAAITSKNQPQAAPYFMAFSRG